MNLIESLQSLASITLSSFATVFEMLGCLPIFVILFALFYLVYNKKFAYNYFLTYASGFIIGSLFLKNVIRRARPYEVNINLKANRDVYSGSLPSAKSTLIAENSVFLYASLHKKINKNFLKGLLILFLVIICGFVSFSQIYFANNYLLDCILGLAIGFIISMLIIKLLAKVNINKKYMVIICLPLLLILLLIFVLEWFTNNFANSAVFEFVGISSSIILGTFIEERFIKFNEKKNNLFFTSYKVLITIIFLIAYFYICKLLPGIVILSFVKYFILGLIVTLLLPLIFSKLEKYFYVFSNEVSEKNILLSSISISTKSTKKVAKKICAFLSSGDVVLLSGDLGAGKSELVRGILTHKGVKKEITSPTFTLVNEYNTQNNHFYHFDMYRIDDEQEVINIDFPEIIDKEDAIKFIEWPEKVERFLPKDYKKITIVKLGKKCRNIIFEDYTNKTIEVSNKTKNINNTTNNKNK